MKTIKTISLLLLIGVSFACKKERQCECKNANGTYPAGTVEATRYNAKKICKDLSTPTTECYLK